MVALMKNNLAHFAAHDDFYLSITKIYSATSFFLEFGSIDSNDSYARS